MQKCSKEALKLKLDNDAIKKSMLLYAITDRGWLKEGETLESVVEDVLKSGATFLQLREKIQGHEEKQREIFKLFAKNTTFHL